MYTPPEKARLLSDEFTLSQRNLKKYFFSKSYSLIEKNHVEIKKIVKPTMVRMVHRNILYSVDLKICDSKSEFGTKTENQRFRQH